VLTRPEFAEVELLYWRTATPIGIVFTSGTIVGFFIGFIVVYQILFTDVTNHLPHFATMKAMGFSDGYLRRLVLNQALQLAVLGYVPGSLLAAGLYKALKNVTLLPMEVTPARTVGLLLATVAMCMFSGLLAVRKLTRADPADVF
jgi:putative ABC transport system permease protein